MKKISFKKMISCVLMLGVVSTSMVGCGKDNSVAADKTMDAFYQLFVQRKSTAMEQIGIDPVDSHKALTSYEDTTIKTLKNQFKDAGSDISTSQAKEIYTAIGKAMEKLKYDVKITDDGSKEATVTISSNYIDYSDVFKSARSQTVKELKSAHIENMKNAKKQLVSNVVKGFEDASVSTDTHSKTFELKKQKIKSGDDTTSMFFPTDLEQTGADLLALVTNQ